MGHFDYSVIAVDLEAMLERMRREKRLMVESLNADKVAFQEKVREHTLLTREKQSMVAEEAPKEKLVANFMVFLDAIDNNDPQISHNFDEKAMMNHVSSMLKSDGDSVSKIIRDLHGKAMVDAISATINSDCSFDEKAMMKDVSSMLKSDGADTGDVVSKIMLDLQGKATVDALSASINNDCSFGGDKGGIGNAPKKAEEARLGETKGTNSDGIEGGDAGECGSGCNDNIN